MGIIDINNVSMHFVLDRNNSGYLKDWIINLIKGKKAYDDFIALQDVSFSLNRGEVLGIIGKNGSGKSTLLKVISGIYKPTKGTVSVNANVVPMLELGSGFDVELTGYENIFLNGAVLGYTEDYLKERVEEIIDFSEIREFIHMPLKTYSSGMAMRLAFSIATIVNPEILIVDEILSVGDEAFQKKSFARMEQLMSGGTTVLFVSHSIDQIKKMCTRVIWLENGSIRADGLPNEICEMYRQSFAI